MARENRSWGYDRIQGALNHLGYTISDQAVGNILKRHGISRVPERQRTVTWREFIRSHLDMLLATDFFNREIWSWCGMLVSCLLSFLHLGRHHIRSVSHQTRQDMRSFVRQALEWSAHGSRWGGFVKALARSQALQCSEGVRGQPTSQHPLRWWGVNSTLFGKHPLDQHPELHEVQEKAPKARGPICVNPIGYVGPTRSASFPTDVNNVLTRFVRGHMVSACVF